MAASDIDKKMRMEVDASDYAMGGTINGMWGWFVETSSFPFKVVE